MKEKILLLLSEIPILGDLLLNMIVKSEGGQINSTTLRTVTEKRNSVSVGLYSYGNCFSKGFNLGGEVLIGRYCSIAENVRYLAADHPVKNLTTSPIFYNKDFGYPVKDVRRGNLVIENDVWIGCNAIILSKCKKIGNGSVVGAGSIVTHDVPPYAIVAGNPAKIIGYRFSELERELLEKSEWWEKEPFELIKYYDYIENPKMFIRKMGQSKKNE